jgi:hypothetical protein
MYAMTTKSKSQVELVIFSVRDPRLASDRGSVPFAFALLSDEEITVCQVPIGTLLELPKYMALTCNSLMKMMAAAANGKEIPSLKDLAESVIGEFSSLHVAVYQRIDKSPTLIATLTAQLVNEINKCVLDAILRLRGEKHIGLAPSEKSASNQWHISPEPKVDIHSICMV